MYTNEYIVSPHRLTDLLAVPLHERRLARHFAGHRGRLLVVVVVEGAVHVELAVVVL